MKKNIPPAEMIGSIPKGYRVGSMEGCAVTCGNLIALAVTFVWLGGLLIGDASIPDQGPMRDRLFTMSGSMVGANIALLYLLGAALWIKKRFTWPRVGIAFRVAAAWLGAISLVMLALGFADETPVL